MIIEILDGAKKDFLDGIRFYEKQSEGVGRYFYDSLMSDIESLHLFAGVHAKQYGFYRMIARRFPYAIYYQIENQIVQNPGCPRLPTGARMDSESTNPQTLTA